MSHWDPMGRAGMLSYNSFINSVFMTVAALSRRRFEKGAWKIQPIWENQGHLRKITGWVGGFSTFSCHSDGFYLIPSLPNVNLLEKSHDFGIYLFGANLVFHTRMLLISWWKEWVHQVLLDGSIAWSSILLWLRLPDHPKKCDVPAMFLRIFGEFQVFPIPSRSFGSDHWRLLPPLVGDCHGELGSWMWYETKLDDTG